MAGKDQSLSKAKKGVMSLNEDCVSCAPDNYRSLIYSSYRVACLNYRPDPVLLMGQKYHRNTLINLRRTILETEWGIVGH